MTIWEARSIAVKQLQYSQNESNNRIVFSTPSLDVDCLLGYLLGYDRSKLLSCNQDFLDAGDEKEFFELVQKRCTGIPIAYLVGKREFFGFDFFVNADVLIPKADTELIVEKALEIYNSHFKHQNELFTFADICTGSGCIALSILKTIFNDSNKVDSSEVKCNAVDISPKALIVAKKNTQTLLNQDQQQYVHFFEGDLAQALPEFEKYSIIVSNPPYVPKNIVDELLQDGRVEPRIALDGDIGSDTSCDGLFIIKKLIPQAHKRLNSGGFLLIETGEYNAFKTALIMKENGFTDVTTYNDLSGQPRVTIGKKL